MTEIETVQFGLYPVRILPFWEDKEQLAIIPVINKLYKDLDIPFPERQPCGNAWVETNPPCTDYYCRRLEVDTFVKFFKDNGCSIGSISHFEYRKIKWCSRYNFPGATSALLELTKNPEQTSAECRLVYRQYDIDDEKGTITLVKTSKMFRFCDAYYGFKNVKTLKTFDKEFDPMLFTKDNPLVLNPFIDVFIVSETVLEPVAYTGVMYTRVIRETLKPTIEF